VHTDFRRPKSKAGLFKMMAIGLGKIRGSSSKHYHTYAYKMGL